MTIRNKLFQRFSRGRALTLLGLAISVLGATSAVADVLDEPAKISARAKTLVQLSVAKAGSRFVSVGERGIVMLSDDQGKNWRQAKVPVSVTLTKVIFVDATRGWAIGHSGVVLASKDGGDTWSSQLDGAKAAQLELDAARQEATPNSNSPRRLAEAERLVTDGADKPLLDIHFFNTQHGIVVGAYGLALETNDGGVTWRSIMGRISAANGRHLYVIRALNKAVYLAGEQGLFLSSFDNGLSFSKSDLPGKGSIFGLLTGASENVLLAFGLKGGCYRTSDAGNKWLKVEMPPKSLIAGLRLKNGALVLADESGQLFRSDDDGQSFKSVTTSLALPFAAISEADDGALVVASVRGATRVVLNNNQEDKRQ